MNCIYTKNNIYFEQNGQILRLKNKFSLKFLREFRDSEKIIVIIDNYGFFDNIKLSFYLGYLDYVCPNKRIMLYEKSDIFSNLKINNKEILDENFKLIVTIFENINKFE